MFDFRQSRLNPVG